MARVSWALGVVPANLTNGSKQNDGMSRAERTMQHSYAIMTGLANYVLLPPSGSLLSCRIQNVQGTGEVWSA